MLPKLVSEINILCVTAATHNPTFSMPTSSDASGERERGPKLCTMLSAPKTGHEGAQRQYLKNKNWICYLNKTSFKKYFSVNLSIF